MRRYRTLRTLAVLSLTTVLYACGTRGPLFLPPVQNKPATANASNAPNAANNPAPAKPSDTATATNVPTTAADLNTPRKPAQ
jgi:predicted small lipoprotein YifL